MSAIRSSHTKPEIVVRRALHAAGLRYRLHDKKLLGKPDLVFPRYKAVVFVHGCFWHQHDCHLFRMPATRQDFWREKLGRNAATDQRVTIALQDGGWRVATVWECALKGRSRLDFTEAMQELIAWIKADDQTLTIRGK
jgi:DNA mismatch endonuclease, patch repair protein